MAKGLTVQCYARDPQGRFWVGTARGVWSLAEDGAEARGPWLIPSPLIGNQVTGVALDSDRRLWVGTSQGLTCIQLRVKCRCVN
jgi:ligand-binding sensor domain-containing protein